MINWPRPQLETEDYAVYSQVSVNTGGSLLQSFDIFPPFAYAFWASIGESNVRALQLHLTLHGHLLCMGGGTLSAFHGGAYKHTF